MKGEDRLRALLHQSARDPGAKQDWDAFLQTAHRDRAIRRAVFVGGAAVMTAVVVLASIAIRSDFDGTLPKPAATETHDRDFDRNDDIRLHLDRVPRDIRKQARRTHELATKGAVGRGGSGPGVPTGGGNDNVASQPSAAPPSEEQSGNPPTSVPRCYGKKATIVGTSGDDVLEGTSGFDVIAGLDGDDVVHGAGGTDYLCGDAGNDRLFGEDGGDNLTGGPGDDMLSGGASVDGIFFPGAPGPIDANLVAGTVEGDGTDSVTAIEVVFGTPSGDTMLGGDETNWFIGDDGADTLDAGGGDDSLVPGPGNDDVIGGTGADLVDYFGALIAGRPGLNVDLSANRAVGDGVDQLNGIEKVFGSNGDDVISGDGADNALLGGFGDDTISGAGGNDYISGLFGDDKLDGGPGQDFMDGGSDVDTCTNGETRQNCEASNPVSGPDRRRFVSDRIHERD